jgi:hypothetical protein
MKFAVASYGTRGDIESCAAVGLELPRAGSGMARRRCRGKHAGSPPRYCVDRHPGWVISDWTAPSIMRPRTLSRPVDEPEVMTDTPEVAYARGK